VHVHGVYVIDLSRDRFLVHAPTQLHIRNWNMLCINTPMAQTSSSGTSTQMRVLAIHDFEIYRPGMQECVFWKIVQAVCSSSENLVVSITIVQREAITLERKACHIVTQE